MDLHPIRPVEFDQALITGQIGEKFIEITLPVKGFRSQWIYTQFDWSNSIGQIQPVELGVNPLCRSNSTGI